MKKAVSLMMAAAMTMGLAACGSSASTDTAASTADAASTTEAAESTADSAAAADGKVYNVGICQLVQHEALDAATQGFKDALVEKLGEGNVKFDEQNASGDSANCATIVNGFVSSNVDLILANATAPLQAAAQATADIPVLGTSVTDYATALDISDWTGTVGGNISGTSDLAPLDQQAAMIQELFPDAKTVGLLYCSAEPNSVYQCGLHRCPLRLHRHERCYLGGTDGCRQLRCHLHPHRQHRCLQHRGNRQCGSAGQGSRCGWRGGHLQRLRRCHAVHQLL